MKTILDNIPVGIFLLDSKRNIVYRNKVAEKMGENILNVIKKNFEVIHKIEGRFYRGRKVKTGDGDIIFIEDVTEKVMA